MTTSQIVGGFLVGLPLAGIFGYIGHVAGWGAALFAIVFAVCLTAMVLVGTYLMTGSLS